MISRFFIDRPIFATVLSVAITLVGGIALIVLPISQYPRITPPSVQVSIQYPGASAAVVADTVAAPIEQQVTGIPGMLYMSSQSANDGSYTLGVTFDVGVNLNTALVMVQNRVALAMPLLPTPVQNQGITIRKRTPDMLLIVSFFSPKRLYDDIYISNFALINVFDELLRVDGVSDIRIMGQRDYSIRVWLDPQKLAARNMTAIDVADAVRKQNLAAAVGQIGQAPMALGQPFQMPVDTLGRLSAPEQFDEIIVKAAPAMGSVSSVSPSSGPVALTQSPARGSRRRVADPQLPPAPSTSIVRLRDVAKVEMGAQNYNQSSTFDGNPAVGVGVYQLPGTNALEVADRVRAKMKELEKRLPEGIVYKIGYDTTPYIRESIGEVYHTLRDAVILVALVVLFFLQDWRAMILPMIDVPVSLIGTFAVMAVMGFSLNNISLFGLVLAIGIVVDDAIVVLENIERQMAKGYDARTATIRAMEEITGPIIAITLVLCAVFVPCAFITGITGRFFRQFAVTIAASTIISAVNALTMTPSRALLIFRRQESAHKLHQPGAQAPGKPGALATGVSPANATAPLRTPHSHKREALPWWIFGLIGGALTVRLAPRLLPLANLGLAAEPDDSAIFSLQTAILFAPGFVAGLVLGWFLIGPVNKVLGALFRGFNYLFDQMTTLYGWSLGKALHLSVIVLLVYGALLALTYWVFQGAPTGFVPQQDMGRLVVSVQLPDSASLERTKEAVALVDKITRATPGVAHTQAISGVSFVQQANSPNFGSLFVILKSFADRRSPDANDAAVMEKHPEAWPDLKDETIMKNLRAAWTREVKEAKVVVFGSSPIPGLSVAGGFKVQVEDKAGLGLATLQDQADKFIRRVEGDSYKLTAKALATLRAARVPEPVLDKLEPLQDQPFTKQKLRAELAKLLDGPERAKYGPLVETHARQADLGVTGVSTQFRSNTPQLYMDIDRAKVAALGVPLDDVNQTLQIFLGSLYVNSFNQFGRHWQVTLQAAGNFRDQVEDINLLQVRNKSGQMVPLGTLVNVREINGPIFVLRYNLSTAAPVTGSLLPGVSSGDVIRGVEKVADQSLPRSMRIEWTELMYLQIIEGNTTLIVFGLAVLAVFLALSALYESWTLPLAVILVVPLCILCSVAGVLYSGTSVNIFVQIGLVVLVGLACKNAILIVEFAKELHTRGAEVPSDERRVPSASSNGAASSLVPTTRHSPLAPRSVWEATVEASRLRLRPILMTSFAFILGVFPLVVSAGAGAEMRRSLGIAVFSGMLGVTFFGIVLTPVFFYVIQGLGETRLFSSTATQWSFSVLLAGFLGWGGGFLLGKLGVLPTLWASLVGACAGVLVILFVLGMRQRVKRQESK
jgi:multidrug efflux pump